MNPNDIKREWFEKDYYQDLGVAKNASQADIKKAYRKLAQKFHPDANPGNTEAEERFKAISAANDVLGDEQKRKDYDEVRAMGASGYGPGGFPGGGRAPGGWPGGAGNVQYQTVGDMGDLGDLLGGMFGGARARQQQPARGDDLETHVSISFEDAMEGTSVPIQIKGNAVCSRCRGLGAEPGSSPAVCPNCGGTGQVAVGQGLFSMARPCPGCSGTGRYIEHPCKECRGSGSVRKTRKFSVKIPAGVKNGARIKLAGRGEPGPPGGRAGDLYVVVKVGKNSVFGRKGDNLTIELPITYAEAALGAQVGVPTLNGGVKLKIPAGTPSGKTFRVKGKGVPKKNGQGDLLVTVNVDVPGKLSKDEKKLLEQLAAMEKDSPRAQLEVE